MKVKKSPLILLAIVFVSVFSSQSFAATCGLDRRVVRDELEKQTAFWANDKLLPKIQHALEIANIRGNDLTIETTLNVADASINIDASFYIPNGDQLFFEMANLDPSLPDLGFTKMNLASSGEQYLAPGDPTNLHKCLFRLINPSYAGSGGAGTSYFVDRTTSPPMIYRATLSVTFQDIVVFVP